MFGNGLLNVAVGATKISAAGAVEVGTSGIGTGLALYGAFSGSGNLASGTLQTIGAFSSNPASFQQAASGISAVTSITGMTTLLATGNLKSAANAARLESFGLFGFNFGSGGSFNPVSATGATVNVAKGAGVPIGCS